ncbi:hypothetical protein DPMN_150853 [Dreissena polymorpha]|uniref:Uncharacterized protein n=1 Tax=Dreissena polymorpha TaxID=45954 RepID=A0A9D4FIF8_DREPO|nr:hypothetical protein DPMN_150853 [Dreissena polymorpha]
MGSESTYKNQYKRIETDISKVRTLFQSTAKEIQEAMNAVREEQVDDELDEIAPNSRQTEEDAELAKEDQISIYSRQMKGLDSMTLAWNLEHHLTNVRLLFKRGFQMKNSLNHLCH